MEITKVNMRPMRHEGNLKAFCSVVFDDVFILHSVKVIQGKTGTLFVAMPSQEMRNGEFRDLAHPIDNEFHLLLERVILEEYWKVVGPDGNQLQPRTPAKDELS